MGSSKVIKVVLLEPEKEARIAEIRNDLEGMQKVVGGLIEPFYPFEEQVCIVCNEEGKIQGLPANRAVYAANGEMVDVICGAAFICGCGGEHFSSLADEQLTSYVRQFRYPQYFFKMGDEILAVPYRPSDM